MLTIFTSVFRMYVGLRFSCIVFVWLCYQSNPGFTESLPLQSFGNFGKGLVLVFLHMLVELTSKATRSRPFLYWEIFFFYYRFNLFNNSKPNEIFNVFCDLVLVSFLFLGIFPFHLVYPINWHTFVHSTIL